MEDEVNYWLMALNRASKRKLPSEVIDGVQDFFNQKFKQDVMIVQKSEFFHLLKPNLQKRVIDLVFKGYYNKFHFIFENCDINFKRNILRNCTFGFVTQKSSYGNESKL